MKTAMEFVGVDVICIQVVGGPDLEVLDEQWVNVASNPGCSIPNHGQPHKFWRRFWPDARYHITPFAKLDRGKYVRIHRQRKPKA